MPAETVNDEHLKYPIGRFAGGERALSESERHDLIESIAATPAQAQTLIESLSPTQLDTPYRPSGWTARQVIHHMADSHLNAYVRFRLALTEDKPVIKPYDEAAWAELADARTAPPEISLVLLEKIHERWVMLMRSLAPESYERKFNHPEAGTMSLNTQLRLYEWHGRHHLAHLALCAK